MGLRKKKSLLDEAVGKAGDYVDAVRPHVESAVDATRDFYESTAKPALQDAYDKAGPALADARDKAAPYVSEARDRAAAALAEARDNAAPVLADARDKAVSAAAPVLSDARDRAGDVAAQAKEAADARVAQLRGEQPKKRSKLKAVALLAVVAGAIGFAAKKLQGGKTQDNWQSSYVPAPAPAAPATDAAGSTPGEAISDSVEETHPVTTPEEPAEIVDVDPATEK